MKVTNEQKHKLLKYHFNKRENNIHLVNKRNKAVRQRKTNNMVLLICGI